MKWFFFLYLPCFFFSLINQFFRQLWLELQTEFCCFCIFSRVHANYVWILHSATTLHKIGVIYQAIRSKGINVQRNHFNLSLRFVFITGVNWVTLFFPFNRIFLVWTSLIFSLRLFHCKKKTVRQVGDLPFNLDFFPSAVLLNFECSRLKCDI